MTITNGFARSTRLRKLTIEHGYDFIPGGSPVSFYLEEASPVNREKACCIVNGAFWTREEASALHQALGVLLEGG